MKEKELYCDSKEWRTDAGNIGFDQLVFVTANNTAHVIS